MVLGMRGEDPHSDDSGGEEAVRLTALALPLVLPLVLPLHMPLGSPTPAHLICRLCISSAI